MTIMNHSLKWLKVVMDDKLLSPFDCQNFFATFRHRHKTLGLKKALVVSTCFIHHFQEEL